ncbi:MAG: hypothetical protein LBL52_02535 [Rickettsiales bacterium]|jgi:hypothetical protein|nr:hypothetical protein [Rickettsiales bacterium]
MVITIKYGDGLIARQKAKRSNGKHFKVEYLGTFVKVGAAYVPKTKVSSEISRRTLENKR